MIQKDIHALRSQIRDFKRFLENSTRTSDLLSSDTFPTQLGNITATVARILMKVNSTSALERELDEDYALLGESLNAVEMNLKMNLSGDVNILRARIMEILTRQNRSENAMKAIHDYLWMSVYIINADVSNRSAIIPARIEELRVIETNMTELASKRMLAFAPILKDLSFVLNATNNIVMETSRISTNLQASV